MPLHNCHHTFQELATEVLPAHMTRMRAALAEPRNMEIFARPGVGSGTLIRDLGIPQDFSGCYVLLDAGVAIYVGFSRGVIGRLRQHAFGKMHFDASLAFRIAMARHPARTIADLTRSAAMKDPLFGTSFAEAQTYLRSFQVAFIAIETPLDLFVFEPYSALALNPHK